MGYDQRAIFKFQKNKAPDKQQMYEHQGLAWVVGAQAIIRLYRLIHKQQVPAQAIDMAGTYVETKT
eukprot:9151616-Karenia_brevis.AAC.1